uniref:Uncharacterized protein LOC100182562 n=1 Tax=Phallusia mammillata TaxID=59560 RepID=A0A6F9DI81_9ASCI|nr:uncharacterized protein LOC100182562 [Phallusia mammillata]
MAGYFKANDFIIPAPDAHVAHYLKNTKPAREQLVGVVRGFAFITIEPSDAQGMQYRFSQLKGKRTVDPDHFAQLCKTHLLEFLNSYTTNKHTFPPGIIQQVEKKNPAFFQNNTAGIFIACYRDNNHVLICGRKEIVEDKMSFLSKLGIERSPVQSAQTVDIQATDIHVAMFLKNSAYHLNKMKEHMKHLGKVFIKIRGKNDVQYQVNLEGQVICVIWLGV